MHLKFQSLDFYLIYLDGSVYQPDNLKDKLDTDDEEVHCALLSQILYYLTYQIWQDMQDLNDEEQLPLTSQSTSPLPNDLAHISDPEDGPWSSDHVNSERNSDTDSDSASELDSGDEKVIDHGKYHLYSEYAVGLTDHQSHSQGNR
jgi:hypothetical protein